MSNYNKHLIVLYVYIIIMTIMCICMWYANRHSLIVLEIGLLISVLALLNPIYIFIFNEKINTHNSEFDNITQKQKDKIEHDIRKAKAYAELELYNDADSETINQAYQRLVLELKSRLDYDEDTKTQEQFYRIEHAYEVLINDIKGYTVDVEKAKRYAILGLPYGADIKTIKTAFKHLANNLHPDHNKDANANRKFIVIDKAYKELIEFFK